METKQLIHDANRSSGFSVIGFSIEWHFQAICKIILFFYWMMFAIFTCVKSSIDIFNTYGIFAIFPVILTSD